MVLNHPPASSMAHVRVCTPSTGFNNCSALTAITYLFNMVGWSNSKLASFVWDAAVAKELVALLNCKEELKVPQSYMPYAIDQGVINKSAFSAAQNPSLCLYIHSIGCLLHNTRSINACINTSQYNQGIINNAKIVAYILRKTVNFSVSIFGEELGQDGYNNLMNNLGENSDNDALGSDAANWLIRARTDDGVPPEVEAWATQQAARIQNPRVDTLGAYIKSSYGGGSA